MNQLRTGDIIERLADLGVSPTKGMGQNFLVAPQIPERIAAGAEVGPQDTVLEVGAGVGTLTAALAARAGRVIAVETDGQLLDVLRDVFGTAPTVELVHGVVDGPVAGELLGVGEYLGVACGLAAEFAACLAGCSGFAL